MLLKNRITHPLFLALLLFFLSLFLRALWLDKIPVGIVHDNMIFVLNAKAFFYTGHDVTGLWSPFSLAPIPDEPAQAELPYIFLAPIIGFLPSSLFAAHIFHATLNSLLTVVLFFLVLKLLSKWPAFIVGLVICFNPWNIFFGRSAFEASVALFFYIFALFILIKTTGWKKLWSLIPLFLGFYTYMAYKITFLPYVFVISLFTWSQIDHKRYTKQYIVFLTLCVLFFSFFILNVNKNNTASRLSELSFFPAASIENQVNYERQLSIQNPLTQLFSNKAILGAKYVFAKYVNAFSPDLLFIDNEKTLRFHIYNHGYFYYADAIFFLLGFYYLFKHKKKLWIFLTSLLLLSPLPTLISNVEISYAMRSSLYIPFLCIFIGAGIWYFLKLSKKKNYLVTVIFIVSGIYSILIANFLYTYFFIQPVYGSEASAFSQRILSRYVALANAENKSISVVLNSPRTEYKDFIYYSDSFNKQTAKQITNTFFNHDYSFKNASFKTCSDVKTIEKNRIYIFDSGQKCKIFENLKKTLSIVQLSDSGGVFNIYQDTICSKYKLKPYLSHFSLNDFTVEKLTSKQLCETFIVDYESKN